MYTATGQLEKRPVIEEHIGLVKKIASIMKAKLPSNIEIDDLIQSGCLGLMDAAEKYKDDQNATFETYASQRIRGAIIDALRSDDVASRETRREQRKIEEAIRFLESENNGEQPKDRDVAKHLGMDINAYFAILTESYSCQQLYIEDISSGASDGENILEHMFPDNSMEPSRIVEKEKILKELVAAIEKLPEKEKLAMSLLYDEDLNLKETGVILNVSESRVCQLHSQAIARIQAHLNIIPIKKKKKN